jgi:hypothetical protein
VKPFFPSLEVFDPTPVVDNTLKVPKGTLRRRGGAARLCKGRRRVRTRKGKEKRERGTNR